MTNQGAVSCSCGGYTGFSQLHSFGRRRREAPTQSEEKCLFLRMWPTVKKYMELYV